MPNITIWGKFQISIHDCNVLDFACISELHYVRHHSMGLNFTCITVKLQCPPVERCVLSHIIYTGRELDATLYVYAKWVKAKKMCIIILINLWIEADP